MIPDLWFLIMNSKLLIQMIYDNNIIMIYDNDVIRSMTFDSYNHPRKLKSKFENVQRSQGSLGIHFPEKFGASNGTISAEIILLKGGVKEYNFSRK